MTDGQDFLRADERYKIWWPPTPKTVEVGEYKVPMPVFPDEKLIVNIDKPKSKQKFTRRIIPREIASWSKAVRDEYVAAQWHRRMNGEWWMLKGEPYYIPGGALPFFDDWTLESGRKADFRYSALTLFWLFYNIVCRSDNIFGIYDLKTRRIGDTANFIFMIWEMCSRHKGVRGGLQSYNDTIAGNTYRRLAKGARHMPFFFRPNRSGSDREFLAWMNPSEVVTLKKLKETEAENIMKEHTRDSEFLSSLIDYRPTVTGAYDGEQLFMALMDELLKVEFHRMDAIKQWANLRRCLSLYGEDLIFGKGFASSTVEKKEKKTAKIHEGDMSTIEIAQWFWDNSDPAMLEDSPDGRTVSGLIRIFRGYEDAARPDEFGFPQIDRAKKFRQQKMDKALKYGQTEMITDIYRKEPGSPEEALLEDNENCPLYPEICQLRINQIKSGQDRWGNPIPDYRYPIQEGVLQWENNKPNTKVVFIPMPGGPWHISQMPSQPNHVQVREVRMRDEDGIVRARPAYVPLMGPYYRAGCDPISANPVLVGRGSKGAIVIKRRLFLPSEEKEIRFNDQGVVTNPEDMITNKIVATYVDRPRDPNLFFSEIVKGCWFFSTPVMLEMDKPEAFSYMRQRGYGGMIMLEPPQIARLRGRGAKAMMPGVRSRGDVVGMYVTAMQMYMANYWPAMDDPRLLKTCSRFLPEKRTKFDLAVAWGMAELGDMDNRYVDRTVTQAADPRAWKHNPYAV